MERIKVDPLIVVIMIVGSWMMWIPDMWGGSILCAIFAGVIEYGFDKIHANTTTPAEH